MIPSSEPESWWARSEQPNSWSEAEGADGPLEHPDSGDFKSMKVWKSESESVKGADGPLEQPDSGDLEIGI